MSTTAVVVIVLVLLIVAVLGIVLARRRRSTQLQEHFGPEYERSVASSGDRRAAEAELAERRQRREEFDVRDLRPEERDRFRGSWNEIQRDFVDDPRRALHSADLLVVEVMRLRGYPVEDDFDRRADDLSVDHPRVVQHYREACEVRDASADGAADVDTERQRTALTSGPGITAGWANGCATPSSASPSRPAVPTTTSARARLARAPASPRATTSTRTASRTSATARIGGTPETATTTGSTPG